MPALCCHTSAHRKTASRGNNTLTHGGNHTATLRQHSDTTGTNFRICHFFFHTAC